MSASNDVLFYPDDSLEEHTLTNLLEEAYERGLSRDQLVLVTIKRRDLRLNSWGYDGAYVYPSERVTVAELEDHWKVLWGAEGDYTPEKEIERSFFESDAIRRRAEFPALIQGFMQAAAKEARTGIGQGAFWPVTKRKSRYVV